MISLFFDTYQIYMYKMGLPNSKFQQTLQSRQGFNERFWAYLTLALTQ